MAFAQIKRKEPEVVMSVPEGLEFNKPYPIDPNPEVPVEEQTEFEKLKARVNENQDKLLNIELKY